MSEKSDDSILSDVNSRLDDLFGDDETDEQEVIPLTDSVLDDEDNFYGDENIPKKKDDRVKTVSENNKMNQNSPINELKSVILSMDWEITDQIMTSFINEINKLKEKYINDKIILTFLNIHDSVGKYIRRKKANAHPDSIKLVHSVFNGLEKVIGSPKLPEKEKKKILMGEVKSLKTLKQQILRVQMSTNNIHEALTVVLEEIKKTIRSEFKALKEELKL
ncbi:MAG: hypothetical protein HQK76_15380 [Desulfobacterales bacterium]|nr:hypothetical protein [Desulfobacterales bacterium]